MSIATSSGHHRWHWPVPRALAGLECNAGSRFWISTVDVRDAFHRMALPDDLSDCFALPGGTALGSSIYASLMVSRSTVHD